MGKKHLSFKRKVFERIGNMSELFTQEMTRKRNRLKKVESDEQEEIDPHYLDHLMKVYKTPRSLLKYLQYANAKED